MFNSPMMRLLIATLIAIPIVLAIFFIMNALISVDEIELDSGEQRVLAAITPQKQDSDVRTCK
jgi:protein TonB